MGRFWQFFLTVAITIGLMGYLYYTSDFYAERSAGPEAALPGEGPAAAEGASAQGGGGIPSKE